jgi:hypothetical protein
MEKFCIACGMPMEKPEHFAMGDKSKDYCVYCARPDGSMQSYDEKLESLTQFMMEAEDLPEIEAREAAIQMMAELPAWSDMV